MGGIIYCGEVNSFDGVWPMNGPFHHQHQLTIYTSATQVSVWGIVCNGEEM